MAGTNNFKPIAVGGSANVITQAAYEALTTLISNGFVDGVADSAKVNKVLRQAAFGTAVLGEIIAANNVNALDDGDVSGFKTKLIAALNAALSITTPDATTTVKGKVALATSAEITAGADPNKAITSAALAGATLVQASIGFGQTYQDVSGSRALSTTYTNSLARPILVSVDFTIPSTGQIIAKVGGVAVAWSNSQQSGNDTGLQFIVPPGATYRVDPATGTPTLVKWFELK